MNFWQQYERNKVEETVKQLHAYERQVGNHRTLTVAPPPLKYKDAYVAKLLLSGPHPDLNDRCHRVLMHLEQEGHNLPKTLQRWKNYLAQPEIEFHHQWRARVQTWLNMYLAAEETKTDDTKPPKRKHEAVSVSANADTPPRTKARTTKTKLDLHSAPELPTSDEPGLPVFSHLQIHREKPTKQLEYMKRALRFIQAHAGRKISRPELLQAVMKENEQRPTWEGMLSRWASGKLTRYVIPPGFHVEKKNNRWFFWFQDSSSA